MSDLKQQERNWQHQHYANVGKDYGSKHFTRADSEFTDWVLDSIAGCAPQARQVAEIGAGTCIFASLLGKRLGLDQKVTCYEPVSQLLEGAIEFDNVKAVCGSADAFARHASDETFDLIYTKDTAHHFPEELLAEIHQGFCGKLAPGGRYLMVVRTPPHHEQIPVGMIASQKWPTLYTPLDRLMESLRAIDGWKEIESTRWEKAVDTPVEEWIDGVRSRDTWSVFSALSEDELQRTVAELNDRFAGQQTFPFLHQYDVALFEKH